MKTIDLIKSKEDLVNNPPHYTSGNIETIDAIEGTMSAEKFAGYCHGNVLKYISRYEHKGGVVDLEKARWFLNRLIEAVGGAK